MHDLDRTLLETESPEAFAQLDEPDSGAPLSPAQELELASELLEVSDEEELEQFLGSLLSKAGGAVRHFASSERGKAVGGYLKSALKQALPEVGRALGNRVRPGGGAAGAHLATDVGQLLGLELEGLSPEDQEFEASRQLVRLASSAAHEASLAAQDADPADAGRRAVLAAVRKFAPGLVTRPHGHNRQRKAYAMNRYDIDLGDFRHGDDRAISPLSEEQEDELASELMEVGSEEELEQFLGDLIGKIGKAAGNFIKSPVGHALGGILKGVAKKALPVVGGAIGTYFAPGVGTAIGTKLGSAASNLFELELESMPEEEAHFEVARRLVGLTAAAAHHAAYAGQTGAAPKAIAWESVLKAAQTYAPGLYRQLIGQSGSEPRPSEAWEEFGGAAPRDGSYGGRPAPHRAGGHRGRPGAGHRRHHRHEHRFGDGDGIEYPGVVLGEPAVEDWGFDATIAGDGGAGDGRGTGGGRADDQPGSATAGHATGGHASAGHATDGHAAEEEFLPTTGTWERRGRRIILKGI